MTSQDAFFEAMAARNKVRVSVRAIVIQNGSLLVQRPVASPDSCYAFIGGNYEVGDTFESRLRREFAEETNATVLDARYLFVVENLFSYGGKRLHGLAHYMLATIDLTEVESREPHLAQFWLPIDRLAAYDLRPAVVADAVRSGEYLRVRRLLNNEWH